VGVLIAIPGTIGYILAGWGDPLLPLGSTGYGNWIGVLLLIPIALVLTPYGVRIARALDQRQLDIGFGFFLVFAAARFSYSLPSRLSPAGPTGRRACRSPTGC